MKILVACEESQAVTIALRNRGHEAYSCDIQNCSGGHVEFHIRCDVALLLNGDCEFCTADGVLHTIIGEWDMIIAFPPCTHLTRAGAAYWVKKRADGRQWAAIAFVVSIWHCKCRKVVIENPIGILSSVWMKPVQIIHPFEFGHAVSKPTCLWIRGLPRLMPTNIVEPEFRVRWSKSKSKIVRDSLWYYEAGKNKRTRSKVRSKTFLGVAVAMADQWTPKKD